MPELETPSLLLQDVSLLLLPLSLFPGPSPASSRPPSEMQKEVLENDFHS